MKKIFTILLFAVIPAISILAQNSKIFQRREIVEMEDDNGTTTFEIFAMDLEGGSQYFIDLGNLGYGNTTVQVNLDPVTRLYVKLGDSLEEAQATLTQYQTQMKAKPGTETTTIGYLNLAVPDEKNAEEVTVTTRKALGRYLQFVVQRDGYVRVATIRKSELGGLLFSLKAYRKIHKKEK